MTIKTWQDRIGIDPWLSTTKAMQAEIDELRAEVTRMAEQCSLYDAAAYKAKIEAKTLVQACEDDNDRLRAENKRLILELKKHALVIETALKDRAALATRLDAWEKQEPEVWQKKHPVQTCHQWENTNAPDAKWWSEQSTGWEIRPLYTKPKEEP
ncbi:MAG: hypothetical protein KGI54_08740 [Pseudomonadota bacterium]|nr:hypothetical protein [Pseudomonadota bacterium]